MILRRSERKRDAVPNAAPTLRTIDPTRRITCIFGSLARTPFPGPKARLATALGPDAT